MNAAPILLPNYTVADWEQWEGRWELIHGVPYAMSPAPNLNHQRVASNALIAFGNALEGCDGCYASQPVDYKIADNTVLEPDMLVLCGKQEGQFVTEPPALVLEVLSKRTASKDRFVKFHYYQQEGVPYYLIVDPRKRSVEVYQMRDDEYARVFEGETGVFEFSFPDGCSAVVDLARFWQ